MKAILSLAMLIPMLGAAQRDRSAAQAMTQAIERHDRATVSALLRKGFPVNGSVNLGMKPLGLAAAWRDPAILSLLLARGAPVNAKDRRGQTALQRASFSGSLECTTLLVKHRANPNLPDRYGIAALGMAADAQITKVLIAAGAKLESRDKDGVTALGSACEGTKLDVVRELIAAGSNVHAKTNSGENLLQVTIYAATSSPEKTELYRRVLAILRKAGVDPREKDRAGLNSFDFLRRYDVGGLRAGLQ